MDTLILREIVQAAWKAAATNPPLTGGPLDEQLRQRCRRLVQVGRSVHSILFTRDDGSFLWNDQRCFHLSLAFLTPDTYAPLPFDHQAAQLWCRVFFSDPTLLWVVGPESPEGHRYGVHHFARFVQDDWRLDATVARGPGWRTWREYCAAPEPL